MLPFLTILDLSNNNLSGEIPASLFNCSYLNVVRLDKNRLTGRIPDGIHQLDRLRNFSVSHNLLSGRIPDRDMKCLDWPVRFKIAVGLARGLAWLHHCCSVQIFHLDLTSGCVLLDQGFEPKLSNFGRAMFVNPNDHDHRSGNLVLGKGFLELGFAKKDVHSFGVVVLELIGGREVSDGESFGGQIDECVAGKGCDGEIVQVMRVAKDCVQPMVDKRPTMLQVVQRLTQIEQGCCGCGTDVQGYEPVVVPSVVIEMGQGIGSKYR
ncbi:unnamed protein product [Linum tenue]|uniref:Protein kinase domain-containing protein n=1 Tax=Linum tenue TaxID=586396 RepID=A0AAV0NL98_9ROSI|nr:unnamed protein product [Linum tenue]